MKCEFIIDSRSIIGEGPVWDDREKKLYFIDVRGKKLHCWNGTCIEKTVEFDQPIGFAVLREQGGLVVGLQKGYYYADMDGSPVRHIVNPEPESAGRFNDGKVDPYGRVWGGTMPLCIDTGDGEVGDSSGLYCLDENLRLKTMLTHVMQGNGLAWSRDTRKFYFIDTVRANVQEFDYDIERNELSHGRVCVEIPAELGIPDGMTIDDEGNIYVALWGGWAVNKYDPKTGELLEKIDLPVPNVTSCCFGGENLDELYITTAAILTDTDKYPQAGGVYRCRMPVSGRPSYRFRG